MSLLEHLLKRIQQAGFTVLVVGRSPGPKDAWQGIPDRHSDAGPAEGLATALTYARQNGYDKVILCAVDMPLLNADYLNWLDGFSASDAVIPLRNEREQYCAARYAVSLLPRINTKLEQGKRSLHAQTTDIACHKPAIPDHLVAAAQSFNTPAEFTELLRQNPHLKDPP
jgi:molybdopterin-guanine dinucleotide biosynthesis protein A